MSNPSEAIGSAVETQRASRQKWPGAAGFEAGVVHGTSTTRVDDAAKPETGALPTSR